MASSNWPLTPTHGPGSERPAAVALGLPVGERGAVETVRVGIPICYELLFPDLVRRFATDGAQVLFAITNDAWYGTTSAPHQHLAMAAFRAVENRRYMVRAANTGITAVVGVLLLLATGPQPRRLAWLSREEDADLGGDEPEGEDAHG